jgi:hypothetical protein
MRLSQLGLGHLFACWQSDIQYYSIHAIDSHITGKQAG